MGTESFSEEAVLEWSLSDRRQSLKGVGKEHSRPRVQLVQRPCGGNELREQKEGHVADGMGDGERAVNQFRHGLFRPC